MQLALKQKINAKLFIYFPKLKGYRFLFLPPHQMCTLLKRTPSNQANTLIWNQLPNPVCTPVHQHELEINQNATSKCYTLSLRQPITCNWLSSKTKCHVVQAIIGNWHFSKTKCHVMYLFSQALTYSCLYRVPLENTVFDTSENN